MAFPFGVGFGFQGSETAKDKLKPFLNDWIDQFGEYLIATPKGKTAAETFEAYTAGRGGTIIKLLASLIDLKHPFANDLLNTTSAIAAEKLRKIKHGKLDQDKVDRAETALGEIRELMKQQASVQSQGAAFGVIVDQKVGGQLTRKAHVYGCPRVPDLASGSSVRLSKPKKITDITVDFDTCCKSLVEANAVTRQDINSLVDRIHEMEEKFDKFAKKRTRQTDLERNAKKFWKWLTGQYQEFGKYAEPTGDDLLARNQGHHEAEPFWEMLEGADPDKTAKWFADKDPGPDATIRQPGLFRLLRGGRR